MLVLAIDTSTSAVVAGLVRLDADGRSQPCAARVTAGARAHAELLTPSVHAVLAEAGAGFVALDAIVCGAGPGPFTGLRVGLVTAAAFGDALDIPVHPVVSLDAIACEAGTGSTLLVATDARRREVYWARYDPAGKRVVGPHVGSPREVQTHGVDRAAGQTAVTLGLPVTAPEHPGPLGLVETAAAAICSGATPAPLSPIYLRRPDAAEPGARKRVTPA